MVNGKQTAFIGRFSNKWPLKALCNIAQLTNSPTHAHIHAPTAVSTMRQPARREQWGVRCLAHGHLHTHLGGLSEEMQGIELATFRLAANPLHLLRHMPSQVGRKMLDAGNGDVMNEEAWQLMLSSISSVSQTFFLGTHFFF